jgi:dTDP-4-dehydrorhamnose 3,5-epimerase
MKFTKLKIPEVILFQPRIFSDDRGFFFESFNNKEFQNATGLNEKFVQDNHSKSTKGTLRGLHYQLDPMAQGKLIRVISGEVYDVAVDIRKDSPTFGHWVGEIISEENKKQLWIPPGFAHGFITLSEHAEFLYKTTNYYSPEHEKCIIWNDSELNIDWYYKDSIHLSEKDKQGQSFRYLR